MVITFAVIIILEIAILAIVASNFWGISIKPSPTPTPTPTPSPTSMPTNYSETFETEYYLFDVAINLVTASTAESPGSCSLCTVLYYWSYGESGLSYEIESALKNYTGPNYERLASYARSIGFRTVASTGNISFVKENIRKGCPVIILDRGPYFGLGGENVSDHYRVVSGYDESSFTTQDPSAGWYRIVSFDDFAEMWNMNWTLVVTPDNQATIDEKSALQENNNIYLLQNRIKVDPSAQIIITSATFVSSRLNYLSIAFNWTGSPISFKRLLIAVGGYTRWYLGGTTVDEGKNSATWYGFPLGWYDPSAQLELGFFDVEGNTPFRSATFPTANFTVTS
jgi:predicted double-glycine peptidase